jgi:hypothetical protein
VAKVSELKDRARALEQQGKLGEALAIYRHILNHLERTPAIKHELPLYVKVGDLSLKLGNPTWAVSMYERAAEYYTQAGSAKTIISLCHKIVRVDESRTDVFRVYAERLVTGGQLQAAVAVLQEHAKRAKKPEVFVKLQGVVDRPDDEARRGIEDALTELDGKEGAARRPAAAPPARTPPSPPAAAPPAKTPLPKPGIGLITEPQLEGGTKPTRQPAHQTPVTPPRIPALKVPPPPPPPPPPAPPSPPARIEVAAGPFAPPAERRPGSVSGPHRVAEPEQPGARSVVTDHGPARGKIVVKVAEKPKRRGLLIGGVAAAVVVVIGVVVVFILGRGPSTAGGRQPTTGPVPAPPPAPAESVAAAPTGPVAQAPPADTAHAAPPPVTQPAPQPPKPAPKPAPARVRPPPAPVTVQLPAGAVATGVFVMIGGLPIDSVAAIEMDGRPGHRVVQHLESGESLVLTAVPVPPGSDSVGLGTPQVMSMFGDVIGARRYWGYQVNVRGSVAEDVLSRLLGRLVSARGGS